MSDSGNEDGESDAATREAVVLDYLPHGRPDDNRPQYQKDTLAYALAVDDFELLELTLTDDADVGIVDRVAVGDDTDDSIIESVEHIAYDDLSNSAVSELEYAVEAIVEAEEQRFVDFYNDAQPITLRLHQLNLLPGIGKKLRNKIIDTRKRQPYEGFEDLSDRVGGLHHPDEVIAERILEEIREDDLKYQIFVRDDE
ncbi:MAG: putative RNA-binding protein [uncultured archaeon A07HN63]|nr:MAG: putative RNA-binding protein [uncultured archaeon A07HN63]